MNEQTIRRRLYTIRLWLRRFQRMRIMLGIDKKHSEVLFVIHTMIIEITEMLEKEEKELLKQLEIAIQQLPLFHTLQPP